MGSVWTSGARSCFRWLGWPCAAEESEQNVVCESATEIQLSLGKPYLFKPPWSGSKLWRMVLLPAMVPGIADENRVHPTTSKNVALSRFMRHPREARFLLQPPTNLVFKQGMPTRELWRVSLIRPLECHVLPGQQALSRRETRLTVRTTSFRHKGKFQNAE